MQHTPDTTFQGEPKISPELLEAARRLKESPFFVNPSDGVPLVDKQQIFLVLAGYKPVSNVSSGHWVASPAGRRTVADDPNQVGAFLTSLGLAYHLWRFDDHATNAVVALKPELVAHYLDSSDTSTSGRLFGYPDSAVKAFTLGEEALLAPSEQEQCERERDLPDGLACFRLSRAHWADELAVVQQWHTTLRAASLAE